MSFVLDASVTLAWCFKDESDVRAAKVLGHLSSTTGVVPSIWGLEVANALLVLRRRKRIEPEQYARARRALSRLAPRVDDEGPRGALGKISDLAEKHALSVYDAAYLELAIRRGLPLASRDADLNIAAKRSGVKTLL